MNGADHYKEAEQVLKLAREANPAGYETLTFAQIAQVHATLALVSATMNPRLTRDWTEVL